MSEPDPARFTYAKEMGVSHSDFFRILPRAMGAHGYELNGDTVHARLSNGSVKIVLGEQQERRIALLRIPYAKVTFEFEGVSEAECTAFRRHFDLYFQRGGG